MKSILSSARLLPAIVALFPTLAHADGYAALDVGLAHRTGVYGWNGPSAGSGAPAPIEFDGRIQGTGVLAHLALGGTFRRRWSIAGEGGLGFLTGDSSGIPHTGVSQLYLGRLGLRVERRFGESFFLRGAAGFEWVGFGYSQASIGSPDNVFDGESTRGIYAGVTAGVRGRHVGGFLRADVAHEVSEHGRYTPITLSLGIDFTWL